MDWNDLGRHVTALGLPILGAQLGGPLGAQVGRRLARKFGADADPAIVAQAIAGADDAPQILEATQAEIIAAEGEREAKLIELYTRDVQHARETNKGHWMTWLLPLVLLAVWVGFTWRLTQGELPDSVRDLIFTGYGSLTTLMVGGASYWLGTSRGSAEKQEQLARRS